GFGARIYPTGRKVFVAQVRVGRRTRRIKIGRFGAFTVDQARERATAIIRAAADGRDPQRDKQETREALTVAELCDQYLEAARVVELLGGIYTWAERRDLVPGPNPVRGVETARAEPKERVLSADEIRRLGSALRRHEHHNPDVVAAVRLIALTGVRKGEACE